MTQKKYFLSRITSTFHGRDIFAPAAAHVSMGTGIEELGTPLDNPVMINFSAPFEDKGILWGRTTGCDHFGNIATNISKKDLIGFLDGSEAEIEIAGIRLTGVQDTYSDVKKGDILALVNSSGLLEISINMGRADKYLNIEANNSAGTIIKVYKIE